MSTELERAFQTMRTGAGSWAATCVLLPSQRADRREFATTVLHGSVEWWGREGEVVGALLRMVSVYSFRDCIWLSEAGRLLY